MKVRILDIDNVIIDYISINKISLKSFDNGQYISYKSFSGNTITLDRLKTNYIRYELIFNGMVIYTCSNLVDLKKHIKKNIHYTEK